MVEGVVEPGAFGVVGQKAAFYQHGGVGVFVQQVNIASCALGFAEVLRL